MPKWKFNMLQYGKDGSCNGCIIFDIKYTNKKENCIICYNDKYLIETQCNHRFCNDCLLDIGISQKDEETQTPCPICRANIDFSSSPFPSF